MKQLSLPQAIEELNRLSVLRYGDKAPRYSHCYKGRPQVCYVHRVRADVSPFLPADELFARGPREHCLAKVCSAIHHAQQSS